MTVLSARCTAVTLLRVAQGITWPVQRDVVDLRVLREQGLVDHLEAGLAVHLGLLDLGRRPRS